jgi:hypothetical protein
MSNSGIASLASYVENAVNTCSHTHILTHSTLSHVELVEKNAHPTPKHVYRNVEKAKSAAFCCSLVAAAKPPHPHKEKKLPF